MQGPALTEATLVALAGLTMWRWQVLKGVLQEAKLNNDEAAKVRTQPRHPH